MTSSPKRKSGRQRRVGAEPPGSPAGSQLDEWMKMALGGDAGAYRRLLVALQPLLQGFARRLCLRLGLQEWEAEDIVQEALCAFHVNRLSWDPKLPVRPWAMTITRNKLVDVRRRRPRAALIQLDSLASELRVEEGREPSVRMDLERLIGRLGPNRRELIRLVFLEGHTPREAALRLDRSEGAVRVALHRTLKTLATQGAEQEPSARNPRGERGKRKEASNAPNGG